jgi:hypothetical protein
MQCKIKFWIGMLINMNQATSDLSILFWVQGAFPSYMRSLYIKALIVHKHILLTFVYKLKIQFWLLDMSTWKLKVALLYIYVPWHPIIDLSMWRLYCGIGFFLFELPILIDIVFFFVKIWHEWFLWWSWRDDEQEEDLQVVIF